MDYSCGIIPFRKNSKGEVEFFVGHPGGVLDSKFDDYWAFLKGHANEGEEHIDCAIREFQEESGIMLTDIASNNLIPLGITRQNRRKFVVAYALYYPNIDITKCFSNLADDGEYPEIDRYAWFTLEELKNKTHPTHINFYEQIIDLVS